MKYEKIELLKENLKELNNENINFYIDLLEKLAKKESVEIVFSGTLSNGKSTVVNAILEENLLQMGIGSTTAKITYINKGLDKLIGITNNNNEVSKVLNSENIKLFNEDSNIKEIKIQKNNFKYPNVTFVDSPGINDINKYREDISYAYVPLADVVVFVLDISKGVTADEKNFFDDKIIQTHKDKIFILLNGLDKVEGEDLSPILNNPLLEEYKLFPISAKQYLTGVLSNNNEKIEKSNFLPFLNEFNSYINSIDNYKIINDRINSTFNSIKDLATFQINSMIDNLSKTNEELDKELNIQKNILTQEEEKVNAIKKELDNEISEIKKYVNESINEIKTNIESMKNKDEIIDYIKSSIDEIVEHSKKQLNSIEIDVGTLGNILNTISKYFDQVLFALSEIIQRYFSKQLPKGLGNLDNKYIEKIPFLKNIINYGNDFVFENKIPEILNNIEKHFNKEINKLYKEKSKELEYSTLSKIKTEIISLEISLKKKSENKEKIQNEIEILKNKLNEIKG
jgi:predicted GTPase